MSALAPDSPVWGRLAALGSAVRSRDDELFRQQIVVPLMESHILTLPRPGWALVPSAAGVAALADKAAFAGFAEAQGLSDLLPARYSIEAPRFPAVLKRTDLNAGLGIAIVSSPEELREKLEREPWAGHRVELQEFVPADTDFVAYLVCVAGRVIWSRGYAYSLPAEPHIRGPVQLNSMRRTSFTPSDISAFESLLRPLAFDGPANIDFRRRSDGRIAIMEINPRLGGTLMRPDCVEDLASCLASIVAHARWHPAQAA